jgi:asparagine synthase (glutamine-hydrolysing)
MQPSSFNHLMGAAGPVFNLLPKSRNNPLTNKIRQASKYAKGLGLSQSERYWQWAGLISENKALGLLNAASHSRLSTADFMERKNKLLAPIKTQKDFNELLLADMQLVLPNDMLTKVDIMSMANALEVRVPFLDHHLVDYVLQLPSDSKINGKMRKRILQDAFRDLLPSELYNRPKHGFEVPLLKWFRTSLKSLIKDDLLSDKLIEEQNIFDPKAIRKLRRKLFSINPGDSHATVWALMVFQWWWKKYLK